MLIQTAFLTDKKNEFIVAVVKNTVTRDKGRRQRAIRALEAEFGKRAGLYSGKLYGNRDLLRLARSLPTSLRWRQRAISESCYRKIVS